MPMQSRMIAIAALALAAGCFDKPSKPPDPVVGAIGTVTLSGAMSSSFSTAPITAACNSATHCTVVIVAAQSPPFFSIHVNLSAEPTVRTYSSSDPDKSASASVSDSNTPGAATWSAAIFPPGAGTDRGTYSMVLTDVGPKGAGWAFAIHGTVDATLIAEPPTTGTVTVHVVF
jgi:hypothetical protein